MSGSSRSSAAVAHGRTELREHLGGEAVEAVDVERRAHREDQPSPRRRRGTRRPGRRISCALPVSTPGRTNSAILPNCASRSSSSRTRAPTFTDRRDRRRVAARVVAVPLEHAATLRRVVLGRDERHVPAVGVPGRDAQRHLLAAAADPERQARLHRLGLALRVGQREVLAVEAGDVLGEQAADALDRLLDLAQAHRRPTGNGIPYASYSAPSQPPPRPERRCGRPRAGRAWPSRSRAPPGAGSRPSTRGCRSAPADVVAASAAWLATASRQCGLPVPSAA